MQAHAMRILAVLGKRVGKEIGARALVEWFPVRAAVGAFKYAARRHADVKMLRVTRIDIDGMQLGAVGGAVLIAAGPLRIHRVVIEAGYPLPGIAAVLAAEQSLRR